uniref:hypothetical protein n=1 Tax=Tessaracoccus timonensis TaxID=2161816 RepID=UPI000D552009|nr:hypothetical protein [Tessaracoccus timonensis]
MAEQEVFRTSFEEWVPQALQVAYSYAEGHDAVERFWVVAYLGETVTPSVVYSVAGKVLRPHELDQAIPELDCSTEAQLEYLLTPLLELTSELDDKVTAAGEELPTRIVLRYDVAEEEMNADMTYDDLQPGVPESKQVSNTELIEQWVARLRTTGNDSASA